MIIDATNPKEVMDVQVYIPYHILGDIDSSIHLNKTMEGLTMLWQRIH